MEPEELIGEDTTNWDYYLKTPPPPKTQGTVVLVFVYDPVKPTPIRVPFPCEEEY